LLAVFMAIIAGLDWWRYALNIKPSPWLSTGLAAVLVVYAAFRFVRTAKQLDNLKLGRDGERAVAQYLEWFRTAGFFVFHDIPNEGANIDHVILGTRGLFTIETKTLSKPLRGECKVRVAGGQVLLNGTPLDRNPIVQSKAQARWLSTFLAEAQFKAFVQPVVVFPGWFVEPFDMKREGVWVLEPKALDRFLVNEPERFSKDQVNAMASALTSYVRSKAAL
jgi:nuclease-like protein